jgi:YD repeat-containing protein
LEGWSEIMVNLIPKTAVLLCLLGFGADLAAAPAADSVPHDLGFSGNFSHNPDDTFEIDFSGGDRLVVDRQGEITTLDVGDAKVHRDKSGRPAVVRDSQGTLYKFVYNNAGQWIGLVTRRKEFFHAGYSRVKKLRTIEFPSRARGGFPEAKGSKP